jgi:hypothetical protein
MKINIYKEESLYIIVNGKNGLDHFFKNVDSLEYTVEPSPENSQRHILKYTLNGENFNIGISEVVAESILNKYRIEFINE